MKALVLLLAFATTAIARPSPQQQAKAHFKQAKAFQKAGEYVRAADEYKEAYRIDPRPEMLFNIAQAYRLAAMPAEAVDYFKRYLDAQPNGPGADEARTHIAELSKQLPAPEPKPEPEPAKPEPAKPEPAKPELAPQPEPPVDQPAPVRESNSTTLRIAGLACVGVGVLSIAAGVKFGIDARDDAAVISAHAGPWTDVEERIFNDGQAAQRNAIIGYAAGGVFVIGGAVLYVMGSRTHVVPVATAQMAGATIVGRF